MMTLMITLITVLPSPCKARLATSGEFAVKRSDGADEVQAEDDDDHSYDNDDDDDDHHDDETGVNDDDKSGEIPDR